MSIEFPYILSRKIPGFTDANLSPLPLFSKKERRTILTYIQHVFSFSAVAFKINSFKLFFLKRNSTHNYLQHALIIPYKIRSESFTCFAGKLIIARAPCKHTIQLGYQRFRQHRGILIEFLLLQHRRV